MTKILYVASPVHAALFNLVVRPEFDNPKGKWARQSSLLEDWVGVRAETAPEGHPIGRTFDAQKTNWNVNDSNWVNPTAQYQLIARVAREANNGSEITKKRLVAYLEELKFTFEKVSFEFEPIETAPIESDLGEVIEPTVAEPIVDTVTE